jgi:hypothetical protein
MERIIYTLPGMFTKSKLNILLLEFVRQFPHVLKRQTQFFAYGAPSGSFLRGGHGDHLSDILTWNDINTICTGYTRLNCSIRLDFSGLNIGGQIPFDVFGKVTAEMIENGTNQICVSDTEAHDAFKQKYPSFNFVASEFNLEEKERDYRTIVRNAHNFDENLPKTKVEILLHNPCDSCSTSKWGECVLQQQVNILSSTRASAILDCPKLHVNIHYPENDNEIENYIKLGYLKFQAFNWKQDTKQLEVYLYDLIKDEYRNEARNWILLHYMEGC